MTVDVQIPIGSFNQPREPMTLAFGLQIVKRVLFRHSAKSEILGYSFRSILQPGCWMLVKLLNLSRFPASAEIFWAAKVSIATWLRLIRFFEFPNEIWSHELVGTLATAMLKASRNQGDKKISKRTAMMLERFDDWVYAFRNGCINRKIVTSLEGV